MKTDGEIETEQLRRDLMYYHADKEAYYMLMHVMECVALILTVGAIVAEHSGMFAFGISLLAVSVVFHLVSKIGLDKEKYELGGELNRRAGVEEKKFHKSGNGKD